MIWEVIQLDPLYRLAIQAPYKGEISSSQVYNVVYF